MWGTAANHHILQFCCRMCTYATPHFQPMRATAGPPPQECTLGSARTHGTCSSERLPRERRAIATSGAPRAAIDARRMSSTYCVQTGPRRARRHRPHPCAPRRAASPWPEPCRPRAPQPGRGLSPPRAAAQWGPRLQPARPCGGRRAGACGGRRAGARGAGAAGFQRREARGRNELPNVGRARAAAGCHGRRAAVALDVEVKAALLANEEARG